MHGLEKAKDTVASLTQEYHSESADLCHENPTCMISMAGSAHKKWTACPDPGRIVI